VGDGLVSGDLFFAALQAARRGWRVFPIRGKRPYFALWRDLATTDVRTIEHWFGDIYRHAGLGAIPPARIVRLDVDVKGDGRGTIREWRTSELIWPRVCQVGRGVRAGSSACVGGVTGGR
jgi:hypothetical protein